jgi:DNA-binding response OmpR family regulator
MSAFMETNSSAGILVVEDEAAIAEAVRARLAAEGFRVRVAADGPQALKAVEVERPDLVVLDLMLPGMDGIEVCREIQRREWVPVLMLTARGDEADKIAGFAAGADDYLTKPFSPRELTYRVKAILRRADRSKGPAVAEPIKREDLLIDPERRRITRDEVEVDLTPLEFDIVHILAERPGIVYSREQLMDRAWGYRDVSGGRVVDSHVARVRRKLGDDAGEPRYIRTVHGVGYSFVEE